VDVVHKKVEHTVLETISIDHCSKLSLLNTQFTHVK